MFQNYWRHLYVRQLVARPIENFVTNQQLFIPPTLKIMNPKCLDLSNERFCLQQFEGEAIAITGIVRDHKATNLGYSNVLLINVSISELSTTTKMEDRQRYFYHHLWIKLPDNVEEHTKSAMTITTHVGGIVICNRYSRQDGTFAYGLKYQEDVANGLCEQSFLESLNLNLNKIRFSDIPYPQKLQHLMALSKTAQDLLNSDGVYTFEYSKDELIEMSSVSTLRRKIGMYMPANRAGRRAQKRLRKRFPTLQFA
jgi:hypothetical protein